MIDLTKTIDLSTTYLGLKLKNPLVASSSPMCREVGNIRRLEDAGASAIVLHSLFEEQIEVDSEELDRFMTEGSDVSAESTASHFPDLLFKVMGPEAYLKHIVKCKEAVKIPIVASLNGTTTGGWIGYAKEMQQAGADALELNIYHIPVDPNVTGEQVEQKYIDLIQAVKKEVTIPVSVKLGPYFSSMANMAFRLDRAGADVLVLFNRFYQPDFDLEALQVAPHLTLSTSDELRLRLHWVALLSRTVKCELAITGGVHTAEGVLKGIMAGAQVVMLTSALLKNGIGFFRDLEAGVIEWMELHEYESIRQMRGSMNAAAVAEPAAFERANYIKVLGSYRA